jgi:immunoglobulin-binding protein 1
MASETIADSMSGVTSLAKTLAVAVGLLDGDTTTSSSSPAPPSPYEQEDNSNKQTPIEKSIDILTKLQTQISRAGTLSKNDVLDDVATSSLELVGVEYHLGRAFLMLPTYQLGGGGSSSSKNNNNNYGSPSILRKTNITRAIDYFHAYLKKVDQLDLLNEATIKEYHTLLDMDDADNDDKSRSTTIRMNQSQIREMKIQRFQRKRAASQKQSQLQSLLQRRSRLGLAQEEEMEGHDFESLSRTLYIETLRLYAEECLEEIQSCNSELEMLEMAIKMEQGRMMSQDPRMHSNDGVPTDYGSQVRGLSSRQPLQMTQITQNPITGELQMQTQQVMNGQLKPIMQRQEIANQVFRPGWNQPTMTLEELGERERADAIQRAEAQKVAEAEAKFKPRRYEQLEKDGMEDNEKLVEASAKLDRDWDDWKEENPRGSGNKMSERGDRNF